MHLLVVACSHWCKSCRAEVQDLIYLCLMQLYSSLVYSLKILEMLIRMNICLHMTYILGKRSCIKRQQASSGIQPLLPVYVCNQEVTTLLPGKVSLAHLKPYQPQSKKSEDESSVEQSSDMWTLTQADCKKFNSINNQVQPYFRPKRDIQPPIKLALWSIM